MSRSPSFPGIASVLYCRWLNAKSAAVTGRPSLQRASGRMWYVTVNGFFT